MDGIYRKYTVIKTSTGEKVDNAFVLRPKNDIAARRALMAYADATTDKKLKMHIRNWIFGIELAAKGDE